MCIGVAVFAGILLCGTFLLKIKQYADTGCVTTDVNPPICGDGAVFILTLYGIAALLGLCAIAETIWRQRRVLPKISNAIPKVIGAIVALIGVGLFLRGMGTGGIIMAVVGAAIVAGSYLREE